MTSSVWDVPRGDQMSMVMGVYSIFGMEPQIVQKGLVMSNIVRFLEKVVTAKHFSAGMYFTAVTQLFATLIVRSWERSCTYKPTFKVVLVCIHGSLPCTCPRHR